MWTASGKAGAAGKPGVNNEHREQGALPPTRIVLSSWNWFTICCLSGMLVSPFMLMKLTWGPWVGKWMGVSGLPQHMRWRGGAQSLKVLDLFIGGTSPTHAHEGRKQRQHYP